MNTIWKLWLMVLSVAMVANPVTLRSEEEAKGKAPYVATAKPRDMYATGRYISVMGGANLYQSSSVDVVDTSINVAQDYDLKSKLGYGFGIKFGYDWPDFKNKWELDRPTDGDFKLFPAIEGEFLYTHAGESNLATTNFLNTGKGSHSKLTYDAYAFMLNGLLKAQASAFRPYIGAGIGAAILDVRTADLYVDGTGKIANGGSDTEVVFAFQAIAGTEYFLSEKWSLFAEYKFLGLYQPKFEEQNTVVKSDLIGNNLLMLGVRFHY